MISKNSNWNAELHKPFRLMPVGKDYLWGGTRLKDVFSKMIPMEPLAETWECSTHPDGLSLVESGKFRGTSLAKILKEYPELLGAHHRNRGELPVLLKLIDAKKDLSIQVHPDDAYATVHEHGSVGKTEMWYVLDAQEEAKLIYGFLHDMDRETVRNSIKDGTIEKYLQKIPVKKNDVFFIPSGCVHAIGEGVLIAEIQQNSNLTYRLYDYDRVGRKGKRRTLHIDKALDVADLKGSQEPHQPMRTLKFRNGFATELLCRCKFFQVERMMVNTERCRQMACVQTGSHSFQVLLCTNGCGVLFWEGDMLRFYKGDCIFLPADSVEIRIHGQAQFLKVEC